MENPLRRFLPIIFLLGFSNSTLAIHPMLSPSPLSSRIGQPVIVAIHRDKSGLLWIGTQEGLYRFDGSSVTVFNSDKRNRYWIPASDIRAISEDTNGDVLVATHGGGLIKWDSHQGIFRQVTGLDLDIYSHLTNLSVLENGNYLLSTKDALALYDSRRHLVKAWIGSDYISDLVARPFTLVEGSPGTVYVGSSSGLTKISLNDQSAFKYDLSALKINNSFGVTAISIINDDELIIGTDSGHLAVLRTTDGLIMARQKVDRHSSVYISDISFSRSQLVIATDRGLYFSDDKLINITNISREGTGLSNNDIYTLYPDGEYMYIGTYNGLDILSHSPFEVFNSSNSGLYNDVLAFGQDDSGHIWVGTYDGLFRYDESKDTHLKMQMFDYSSGLIDHRITAIAVSEHNLWLGFYQGGVQVVDTDRNTSHILNIKRSEEIFVTDLYVEKGGENVWIATYSHGLIRVKPDGTDYFLENNDIPHRKIMVLFQLSTGELLVATNSDIYIYDPIKENFSKLTLNFGHERSTPLILSINEDHKGNVWFGTKDHGLFRWSRQNDDEHYQILNASSVFELNFSTIYGIEIDDLSNLWCSTQNGIVKLDPQGKLVKRFTTIDGLQGNDFNFGASFTGRDGLIYFGGVNGYNRFDPDKVEIDRSVSPMRLTNLTLPGRELGNLHDFTGIETLELAHDDRFVTFEFSVLDFIQPEKHQFRYMLKNFDSDWIESGTRNTATYTNLPSGYYVLRVQGANSAGIWNREGITLNVHVSPPPWYSWWAYCLYSISFLFLMWCSFRIYRSYLLDRESKLMAIEMFEAENRAEDEMQEQLELQDELVQSAYDHNLATLALVGDFISHQASDSPGENALAKGSLKRISALSHLEDCLYYYEGGPVVNLKKYVDILISELLRSSPIDPGTLVTINEILPRLVSAELGSPLAVILFELLENCILHAFDGKSPANYIRLAMDLVDSDAVPTDALQITVSDNGGGMTEKPEGLSGGVTGIAVVQALVKDLGGTLAFTIQHGTFVSVTVPIPESLDF